MAARLETRVRDGMSLSEAARRALDEALARNRDYGFIAVSNDGHFAVAYTSNTMSFVVAGLDGIVVHS